MPDKIKILPDNISNKIAAGEVVERPASVVKELLENSLDAEAKNIEVYIKQAGKTLIHIVDDGSGMSEEDAVLCLQRHATSKIEEFEDLENILTFGFRGEALSSIASVAILELKTQRRDDEIGTSVRVDENSNVIKEKGSFPAGTSIAVKNLFYNTPARRNFLKSNATELKHLIDWFKRIALSHPASSFKLYNDEDLILDYPSGSTQDRVKSVFADNILDVVIEVNEPTEYISLSGYIAKPMYLKKSRGEQYLFINGRYVGSKIINHAVFSSYENLLEKGDYPFFVLFMEIDPKKVDVNVHPAKLEIKFDDEKGIYSFVQAVIKKSLGSFDLSPTVYFRDENESRLTLTSSGRTERDNFDDRPIFNIGTGKPIAKGGIFTDDEIEKLFSSINKEIKESQNEAVTEHPFGNEGERRHEVASSVDVFPHQTDRPTFIVALHNKYILAQIKSGLMVIDQHVAHERILYEKAIRSFSANMPFAQQLLFSQTVKVDAADYELLKELEPFLIKLGFEIKFFGKNTIVIDGVPSDIKLGNEVETVKEILDEYKENERQKNLDIRDNLAKSYSCKAAIKAGDRLNETEMRQLVDQLFATSMPYVCPHGRPIIIKIPLDEFDKRFGRT
ncbi:MAG: DNA mismatch repair endonuclease MutL [bacterium]